MPTGLMTLRFGDDDFDAEAFGEKVALELGVELPLIDHLDGERQRPRRAIAAERTRQGPAAAEQQLPADGGREGTKQRRGRQVGGSA